MKKHLLLACLSTALCSEVAFAKNSTKVVLIGLDGIQYEKLLEANTPNIDKLNMRVGYTGGAKGGPSEQATFSGPSWSTILTGTWANKHGVYNNSDRIANPSVPSMFKVLSDQKHSVSALVNWSNPIRDYFTYDLPLMDYAYYSDVKHENLEHYRIQDEKISHMFGRALDRHNADFTFVHLDNVDDIGHELGFGSDYQKGIELLDENVGTIINEVDKRENEDWLVIVTTDHGRNPNDGGKSHGKQTDQERTIWIASNKNIGVTGDQTAMLPSLSDIAPTIYEYLDINTTNLMLDGQSLLVK
ncbi:MAG: alkaline phosphatase family protein [Halopseudomonas sp.]